MYTHKQVCNEIIHYGSICNCIYTFDSLKQCTNLRWTNSHRSVLIQTQVSCFVWQLSYNITTFYRIVEKWRYEYAAAALSSLGLVQVLHKQKNSKSILTHIFLNNWIKGQTNHLIPLPFGVISVTRSSTVMCSKPRCLTTSTMTIMNSTNSKNMNMNTSHN